MTTQIFGLSTNRSDIAPRLYLIVIRNSTFVTIELGSVEAEFSWAAIVQGLWTQRFVTTQLVYR